MATKAGEDSETLSIPRIDSATAIFHIVGTRPLVCNRMSEKARQELLAPKGRKTTAEKQANLKHNPVDEFRASPYILDDSYLTFIGMMSSAFKGAMATAALDLPGTKKAQIGRLVWVQGDYTPIYGLPRLFMSVTRSADMNRTPDIRTRAIIPQWACKLEVTYVRPLLNQQAIFNLLYAAGLTVGVGDWRNEKGKGTFGQFAVVNHDDPQLQAILQHGREAQRAAMETPEPYDAETEEMLSWWNTEVRRRGFAVA